MSIKPSEKLDVLLGYYEASGQSEYRLLAEFTRDILVDAESCDGLVQSSMQEFIDAAQAILNLAEAEKL